MYRRIQCVSMIILCAMNHSFVRRVSSVVQRVSSFVPWLDSRRCAVCWAVCAHFVYTFQCVSTYLVCIDDSTVCNESTVCKHNSYAVPFSQSSHLVEYIHSFVRRVSSVVQWVSSFVPWLSSLCSVLSRLCTPCLLINYFSTILWIAAMNLLFANIIYA